MPPGTDIDAEVVQKQRDQLSALHKAVDALGSAVSQLSTQVQTLAAEVRDARVRVESTESARREAGTDYASIIRRLNAQEAGDVKLQGAGIVAAQVRAWLPVIIAAAALASSLYAVLHK